MPQTAGDSSVLAGFALILVPELCLGMTLSWP